MMINGTVTAEHCFTQLSVCFPLFHPNIFGLAVRYSVLRSTSALPDKSACGEVTVYSLLIAVRACE